MRSTKKQKRFKSSGFRLLTLLFVLPAKNRLKKTKDFQKVFKKGKGIKENSITLKWLPNNLKLSRFGFVVSKKVSKKATLRNKIKRRLREKIRLLLPRIKTGTDGVIIVGFRAEKEKIQEFNKNLNRIFSRTKLIKK